MTAKQFFKSNIFKCLITLLCVLLVSGIFLTVAYGFLEVTDEERRSRAISKIYGKSVTVEEVAITGFTDSSVTIKEAYKVKDDGNYLIKATGNGGYQSGTVTCWVVVKVSNNAVSGVGKVVIDSNTNQTLMNQFTDSVMGQFESKYNASTQYDSSIITGASATLTKNAICNAVNGAVSFVKLQFGPTWVSPYADFKYISNININENKTTHEVMSDGSVAYHIITKTRDAAGAFTIDITVKDSIITKYEIITNGSTENYDEKMPAFVKDGSIFIGKGLDYFTGIYGEDMAYSSISVFDNDDASITTGATTDTIASNSTYLCMYAGAFATANYKNSLYADIDPFEGLELISSIDTGKTTYEVMDDGSVAYHIITKTRDAAGAFTIDITVKDGIITKYEITKNGSTDNYDEKMPAFVKDGSIFVGKGLDYFTEIYGEDMAYSSISVFDNDNATIETGATTDTIASNSTYLCMYAGAFATKNYEAALSKYTFGAEEPDDEEEDIETPDDGNEEVNENE